MRLESQTRLQVSFQQDPLAATPCEPVAQGGYLGAENQLIRVQVASVDGNGTPTLVWSFDNASFLYRVDIRSTDTAAGTTVLHLPSPPVDQYHQPAAGQAVEVLRAGAKLSESPAEAAAYAAATTGIVTTVTAAFQPDTQEVVIGTALGPPETDSPVVFLRVWQETIAAAGGGPYALGETGVQVTIDPSGGAYHVGDYWIFSVRPGTPTAMSPVYPQRYLDAPQPPEGPRLWICPLAVILWSGGSPTVVDCRNHFGGLVTVGDGECCCICVSVDAVGGEGLQALINRYINRGPITFCLEPGTYSLPRPLVLTRGHSGVTIKACGPGVVIEPVDPAGRQFLLGLLILDQPDDFELRGVELHLPLAPFALTAAQRKAAGAALLSDRRSLASAFLSRLGLSLGVYLAGGGGAAIRDCTFVFPPAGDGVFGAGVFAVGSVDGLELEGNRFEANQPDPTTLTQLTGSLEADNRPQLRYGYLQIPSRVLEPGFAGLAGAAQVGEAAGATVRDARMAARAAAAAASAPVSMPALLDASVSDNDFDGVSVPMFVFGRLGVIRIDGNTVRSSYGGFWLVEARNLFALTMLDRLASVGTSAQDVGSGGLFSLGDPAIMLAVLLGRILPLTPDPADPAGGVGSIQPPRKSVLSSAETLLETLYAGALAPAAAPAGEVAPSPPPAATSFPHELAILFKAPTSATAAAGVAGARGVEPRLYVSRNDVDGPARNTKDESGAALLVAMLDTEEDNSLVCSDNRFSGRAPAGSTVGLVNLLSCAVTGNLVDNEAGGGAATSIVLAPAASRDRIAVAVTGNVFTGRAQLPPRPLAPPFDRWDGLNTELP